MNIGTRKACGRCGQDIEWWGQKDRWRDRGGNRQCCPYTVKGEVVTPADGAKHDPAARHEPVATLRRVQMEVGGPDRRGRPSYRWVEGREVTDPNGNALAPYMRLRDARAFCKEQGWCWREATL